MVKIKDVMITSCREKKNIRNYIKKIKKKLCLENYNVYEEEKSSCAFSIYSHVLNWLDGLDND